MKKIISSANSSTNNLIQTKKNKKWILITIYLIIFFLILIILLGNFFYTKNAFDPKNLDYLSPTDICKKSNDLLNSCLSKYKEKLNTNIEAVQIDDCVSFSLNVQNCYDDVMNFNKKCSIYLTMLFKCMYDVNNKNDTNYIRYKCMDSYDNLKRCNMFDDLTIQADKIFGTNESSNIKANISGSENNNK